MYPELMIAPMREELTRHNITALKTAEDAENFFNEHKNETTLLIINSVCGCAAGKARPVAAESLSHDKRPQNAVTVFAGADLEAVTWVRDTFAPHLQSSPSMALIKDGKVLAAVEREIIQSEENQELLDRLHKIFEQHC